MWYCVLSCFFFLLNAIVSYIYSQYVIGLLWALLWVTSIIYHCVRLAKTSHLVNTDMIIRANKKNKWLDVAYLFDITVTVVLITYILYVHLRNMSQKTATPYIIITNIVIFLLLGYILFIFFYGNQIGNYCFHKDSDTAEKWHSTIHISCSFANQLVMLLL
jgi:hypothetical protein